MGGGRRVAKGRSEYKTGFPTGNRGGGASVRGRSLPFLLPWAAMAGGRSCLVEYSIMPNKKRPEGLQETIAEELRRRRADRLEEWRLVFAVDDAQQKTGADGARLSVGLSRCPGAFPLSRACVCVRAVFTSIKLVL